MLSILLFLIIMIPLFTGVVTHLIKAKLHKQQKQLQELKRQLALKESSTKKEQPKTNTLGILSVAERNKLIKDYQAMNFNLSAELLKTYKIMEFNSRTDFINFINKDITGGRQ